MFPGMNSKQMKSAMQKMGMQQDDLDAVRVIIELSDKKLVFDAPEVSKVNMMGQASYQVAGIPREESLDAAPEINDEDIETVAEQAGVSNDVAKKAIEDAKGDLAEAIMNLMDLE